MAVYLPLFVGGTRWVLRTSRSPLWLAAPCVWTVLEWLRGYVLTGFSLCLLGHTQVHVAPLVQGADIGGAYLVSFLIVLVNGTIDTMWHATAWRNRLLPLSITTAVVGAYVLYGISQLQRADSLLEGGSLLRVAIIQGSIDTTFGDPPANAEAPWEQYLRLTREAFGGRTMPDVILWPETIFPTYFQSADAQAPVPRDASVQSAAYEAELARIQQDFPGYLTRLNASQSRSLTDTFSTHWILGANWVHYGADGGIDFFNSAIHLSADGSILARYDKMHPVMFGEYVPLGKQFPWLYRLTPMPYGLTSGTDPVSLQIRGRRLSTCICFENTVPHLVASQVRALDARGQPPDILVTLTNDGWFWGSSLLDLHLACAIYRSVEHRCAGLVAANTGFSAWIDPWGRIRNRGPRRATGVLQLELPEYPAGTSLYRSHGDLFCALCLAPLLPGVAAQFRSRLAGKPRA